MQSGFPRIPKARADDLMAAFTDRTIEGIISTIGGEDSIRTLPYLDLDLIRNNPKVFIGFSDTTISHAACFKAGYRVVLRSLVYGGVCREQVGCSRIWWIPSDVPSFLTEPIGIIEPNRSGMDS